MTTGYLAAFATLICWTIATFVLAKLSRLVEPHALNKASLFFSMIMLGVLVCIIDNISPLKLFTAPYASNWLWLGISGILGKSLGDYCGFRALRILGARRRSMVTTLGPGFTWLFGMLILNEVMNWVGVLGMMITIISLLHLISADVEKQEVKMDKFGLPLPGLMYGIAGAALTGFAFILSKMTVIETDKNISAFHATWIRIITAFFALVIFDLLSNRKTDFVKQFIFNKEKGTLLFYGILFGAVLGLSFSLMAITNMNAAVAYTIFALVPVAVIFVSVIFYQKRITARSWLYSLLAIIGVVILVWRDLIGNEFN